MYKFSGERLRKARTAKGLLREHLAIAAGRTAQTIELYESGRVEPKISTAYAMASTLGIDVGDLLEETVTDA